jgi:hypothetical protein
MHSKIKYDFSIWLCVCLILAAVIPGKTLFASKVAVIEVKYRRAAELVPVVQSLLSTQGKLTVSQRSNSFVIVDSPEAIARVHAYLERFDRPVEQVRVHVRFPANHEAHERSVDAGGRVSNDNVSVSVGGRKKDGADIRVRDRSYRRQSYSSAFVVAMSGSPAYIRSGYQIPYRANSRFFRRYGPRDGNVTWRNVESGIEVTPTVVGKHVHLRIVPFMAYDDRKDAIVRFFEAETEVTAQLGQWTEISGGTDQKNAFYREFLSHDSSSENAATGMSVMVERP